MDAATKQFLEQMQATLEDSITSWRNASIARHEVLVQKLELQTSTPVVTTDGVVGPVLTSSGTAELVTAAVVATDASSSTAKDPEVLQVALDAPPVCIEMVPVTCSMACPTQVVTTTDVGPKAGVQELDALSVNTTPVTTEVDHGVVHIVSSDLTAPTLTKCSAKCSRRDTNLPRYGFHPAATSRPPDALACTGGVSPPRRQHLTAPIPKPPWLLVGHEKVTGHRNPTFVIVGVHPLFQKKLATIVLLRAVHMRDVSADVQQWLLLIGIIWEWSCLIGRVKKITLAVTCYGRKELDLVNLDDSVVILVELRLWNYSSSIMMIAASKFCPMAMLELHQARSGIESAALNRVIGNMNLCKLKWSESLIACLIDTSLYSSSFSNASEGDQMQVSDACSTWQLCLDGSSPIFTLAKFLEWTNEPYGILKNVFELACIPNGQKISDLLLLPWLLDQEELGIGFQPQQSIILADWDLHNQGILVTVHLFNTLKYYLLADNLRSKLLCVWREHAVFHAFVLPESHPMGVLPCDHVPGWARQSTSTNARRCAISFHVMEELQGAYVSLQLQWDNMALLFNWWLTPIGKFSRKWKFEHSAIGRCALIILILSVALKYMERWFTTAVWTEIVIIFNTRFFLQMGSTCSVQPVLLITHSYQLRNLAPTIFDFAWGNLADTSSSGTTMCALQDASFELLVFIVEFGGEQGTFQGGRHMPVSFYQRKELRLSWDPGGAATTCGQGSIVVIVVTTFFEQVSASHQYFHDFDEETDASDKYHLGAFYGWVPISHGFYFYLVAVYLNLGYYWDSDNIKDHPLQWDPGGFTVTSAWGQAEFQGGRDVRNHSYASSWAGTWAFGADHGPSHIQLGSYKYPGRPNDDDIQWITATACVWREREQRLILLFVFLESYFGSQFVSLVPESEC